MDVKSLVNEAYTLALKQALEGMVHSFPGIKNALIFDESGDIVAMDDKISEDTAVRTVNALDKMLETPDLFGNLENIVFQGVDGLLGVSRFDDLFLVTVASARTDLDQTRILANVLIPTVLKVLGRVNSSPEKEGPEEPEIEHEEPLSAQKNEESSMANENNMTEHTEESAPKTELEDVLPEAQVNQLIVENLGGLFASSETVRIDNSMLSNWNELYGEREIEEIEIATFGGKSVRCKVKPIKDAKFEGKGLVQIHEKVQSTLEIKKGELVRIKPVIE